MCAGSLRGSVLHFTVSGSGAVVAVQHSRSVQERVWWEIRTLRAMWRASSQLTVRIVTHPHRKRGATDWLDLRNNGASP
jgi:hypothetical protein